MTEVQEQVAELPVAAADADLDDEAAERDDQVLPLPRPVAGNPEKERTLSRSRVSVKDLSRTFEEKMEKPPPALPPRKTAGKAIPEPAKGKKAARRTSAVVDDYPYTPLVTILGTSIAIEKCSFNL
jgi:hypothetical protein